MMGIGFPELMIILVIIMIIFGAGKLPQIGSAFGQSIKNFKTSMKEVDGMEEKEGEDQQQPAAIENTAETNPAPGDGGEESPAPESEKPASPA
ncbi:twin-arginine translocase TatA/TatE family subunit [Nitrospina sp. 32_T5]|uniref:twin-arginine translocase TatA/TatE family subunit n=1 Tax=unclassified Nitrospina TaxID=2638683 RepID=UPI003F9817F1